MKITRQAFLRGDVFLSGRDAVLDWRYYDPAVYGSCGWASARFNFNLLECFPEARTLTGDFREDCANELLDSCGRTRFFTPAGIVVEGSGKQLIAGYVPDDKMDAQVRYLADQAFHRLLYREGGKDE